MINLPFSLLGQLWGRQAERARNPSSAWPVNILLIDSDRWSCGVRLAHSLATAGCRVSAACPSGDHPLRKLKALRQVLNYSPFRPIQSLASAIESTLPDLVIPCDERALQHLHELYEQACQNGSVPICRVIERSLGNPENYTTVTGRHALLKIATEEGINVPTTAAIGSFEDLDLLLNRQPFPWVMKADGTWGGRGVRIANSLAEARSSLSRLSHTYNIPRAIKRMLINRDPFWLRSCWRTSQTAVVVQKYIQGIPANCAAVAWDGKLLACTSVEVICARGVTEPAVVVRVVNNPEMHMAAERIAQRLQLSGFFGLDFMIESASGKAYLIEMNPRVTPLSHLRLGEGRDLTGAVVAQLSGKPQQDYSVTKNDTIAYFPQALEYANEFLSSSYLDIPIGEPELAEELRRPWPQRTFVTRTFSYFQDKFKSPRTPPSEAAFKESSSDRRADGNLGPG